MFNVESICKDISHKVGQELEYDKNKIAVINYGLFAFVQTVFSILLVLIFGWIFNCLNEALIIAFSASILRKYSGGVHATTPLKCAIFGMILSVGMSIIVNNINISFKLVILIGVVIFIISYYLIYKLAPVDSAAKPIRKVENIKRLKGSSILILTIYLAIIIFNIFWYLRSNEIRILKYSICIYIGLSWQVFSLTESGHKLLNKIDALF